MARRDDLRRARAPRLHRSFSRAPLQLRALPRRTWLRRRDGDARPSAGPRTSEVSPSVARLRQLVHDGVAAYATLREVLTDDDTPAWVNAQHSLLDAAERSTNELLERATMLYGILNTEAHGHELSRAGLVRLDALVAAVVRAATTCMKLAALTDAQRAHALGAESANLRDAIRAFSEAAA